jgi:hypothetical protein
VMRREVGLVVVLYTLFTIIAFSSAGAQDSPCTHGAAAELAEVAVRVDSIVNSWRAGGPSLRWIEVGEDRYWSLADPSESRFHTIYKELRVGSKYPSLMRDSEGQRLFRSVQPLIGVFQVSSSRAGAGGLRMACDQLSVRLRSLRDTIDRLSARLRKRQKHLAD